MLNVILKCCSKFSHIDIYSFTSTCLYLIPHFLKKEEASTLQLQKFFEIFFFKGPFWPNYWIISAKKVWFPDDIGTSSHHKLAKWNSSRQGNLVMLSSLVVWCSGHTLFPSSSRPHTSFSVLGGTFSSRSIPFTTTLFFSFTGALNTSWFGRW